MAGRLRQLAEGIPAGHHLKLRRAATATQAQPQAAIHELGRAFGAPKALDVRVVGRRPHQVADDGAVRHADQRGGDSSLALGIHRQVARQPLRAGEGDDASGPGTAD